MPAPQSTQVGIAKSGGVLPISVTNSKPHLHGNGPHNEATKSFAKLKVLIRRLPPGLTQDELEQQLGEEWKVGNKRVTWANFKAGKVSKDLSKASRPSRMYLQLAEATHLQQLAEKVRLTSFTDARATMNDACLLGPPILEFATYTRIPNRRKHEDARQGTIDQDAEFIEFLESLTNPIVKPTAIDGTPGEANKEDSTKATPLIQYLRDKKTAKEKAALNKSTRASRQPAKADSQDQKPEAKNSMSTNKATIESADKRGAKPPKIEKLPKETGKSSRNERGAPTSGSGSAVTQAKSNVFDSNKPETAKVKENSNRATAAARLIQRDLGIKGRQRGTDSISNSNAAKVDANEKVAASSSNQQQVLSHLPTITNNNSTTKTPTKAAGNSVASVEPGSKLNAVTTAKENSTLSSKRHQSQVVKATRAFLKHANSSQGITESLLLAALKPFGDVMNVEIDKRKGFAYAEFGDPDALQKAIKASPIKVAQGTVTVLERRDRGTNMAKAGNSATQAPLTPSSSGTATVTDPSHVNKTQLQTQCAPSAPTSMRGTSVNRGSSPVVRANTAPGSHARGGTNTHRGSPNVRGGRGNTRGRWSAGRNGFSNKAGDATSNSNPSVNALDKKVPDAGTSTVSESEHVET